MVFLYLLFHVALSQAQGYSWQVQTLTSTWGPTWQEPGMQAHVWHLILYLSRRLKTLLRGWRKE